ncbi:hypothetical protein NJE57_09615 [Dietzia sp. PP-33]|nr:hypothetical protein [Dietzia sp. PP-33]
MTAHADPGTEDVNEVLDRIVTEQAPATTPDGETLTRALDEVTPGEATTAQANCRLAVWEPGQGGNTVGVQGGRYDCTNPVGYRVELWRDDVIGGSTKVDESHGFGTGAIRAFADCAWVAQDYWGTTVSDTGAFMASNRVRLC